jgi:hypothetical protein
MPRSPISEANSFVDLTTSEEGDLTLWIGQQKQYHNVPNFVSNELSRRTAALPSVTALLPPASLPVIQVLNFTIPIPMDPLKNTPNNSFSFHKPTHASSECFLLPVPLTPFLNKLKACAGQAMLDGKTSVQHWNRADIFLPFDALGTWALIIEVYTAKERWNRALQWMKSYHQTIPKQYIERVMDILHRVPWKDFIKGLGTGLMITDMATFLSEGWLSTSHIDSMLAVTAHLHHDALINPDSRTEIVLTDFLSHICMPDYAAKCANKLCTTITHTTTGIRIATVAFSPPSH